MELIEENVLPAVIIVVEKAGAAAHGFRQILFSERAGVVFEVDAGLRGDVGESMGPEGRAARRILRGDCVVLLRTRLEQRRWP